MCSVLSQNLRQIFFRCMRVHYYTLDHITRGGVLPDPPYVPFTTRVEHAWDGIGPWRA